MAMGSVGGSEGGLNADINITPMIDVLLVLLIIFMITQPMSRRAFDVQTPEQRQQQQRQPQSSQIVLELRPDGSYAINNQPYQLAQLPAALYQVYEGRPAKLLFIKAGQNRIYQDVVEAMDVARGAGVQITGFTPEEADRQQ